MVGWLWKWVNWMVNFMYDGVIMIEGFLVVYVFMLVFILINFWLVKVLICFIFLVGVFKLVILILMIVILIVVGFYLGNFGYSIVIFMLNGICGIFEVVIVFGIIFFYDVF